MNFPPYSGALLDTKESVAEVLLLTYMDKCRQHPHYKAAKTTKHGHRYHEQVVARDRLTKQMVVIQVDDKAIMLTYGVLEIEGRDVHYGALVCLLGVEPLSPAGSTLRFVFDQAPVSRANIDLMADELVAAAFRHFVNPEKVGQLTHPEGFTPFH